MSAPPNVGESPRLTFASGGWVIVLGAIACLLLLLWAFASVIWGTRPVGDGATVESYGFDLSTLDRTSGELVASGNPRDFLAAMVDPDVVAGADVAEINRRERGKFLVSSDRVIGVEVGGAARAYPLRVMNAHEVVNDTLGGEPIVVTYSPLTDSVVVASRRVDDRVVEFGVSGLLYDSNLVLYDRVPDDGAAAGAGAEGNAGASSLWSQLEARAIAGPAAARGTRLELVPGVQLVAWDDWLAAHPDTTVIARDPAATKRYKEIDYRRYWAKGELLFPVPGLPEPPEGVTLMTPIIAVRTGDRWETYPFPRIAAGAGMTDGGRWITDQDGVELVFTWRPESETVGVEASDPETVFVHARWFGWGG